MNIFSRFLRSSHNVLIRENGITGRETAIVLIAFVVVSSVFAFAALSTGMFPSDKARETIPAGLAQTRSTGLAQTRSTMELRGTVIGLTGTSPTSGTLAKIDTIDFHVTQSAGGVDVDLTPGTTIIKYTDDTQSKLFGSTAGFTVTGIGSADSDYLLERNEVYKIEMINLATTGAGDDKLTTKLQVNKTFTLEVIPTRGAVLHIERTTPIFFDIINFLN